ncbi:MAG: glycerol acyltransferase [Salinivirgaceae bacterium]|nr:glycerol acyltransferase [Salinivirgaceae bacterium]
MNNKVTDKSEEITTPGNDALRLDVDAVLKAKLPRHRRFIPRFLVNWLKRTICQDQLNALLESNEGRRDADFCEGVLNDLSVTYSAENADRIDTTNRRVTIACNHPLGGLDAMALIAYFGQLYGGKIHFIANDNKMAINPHEGVFIPVNKHGGQSRDAIRLVDEAFAGDDPMLIFPAGLCSRRQKDGSIADLEWKKMFVTKSAEFKRDIIPVHFDGQNSPFFYKLAQRRKRLGVKFNVEMIYLPSEVFKNRGKHFTISIGEPIPHFTLSRGKDAAADALKIREIVYSLTSSKEI